MKSWTKKLESIAISFLIGLGVSVFFIQGCGKKEEPAPPIVPPASYLERPGVQTAIAPTTASPAGSTATPSTEETSKPQETTALFQGVKFTQVTKGSSLDSSPVWLPEDKGIVYFSYSNGAYGIWTVSILEGNSSQKIADLKYARTHASLSPDGKTILFAPRDKGVGKIYGFDLEKKDETIFFEDTSQPRKDVLSPSFSPDGKMVVFIKGDTIWTCTSIATAEKPLDIQGYCENPSWNKDSNKIVFKMGNDIYIADAEGKEPKQLTKTAWNDYPKCSPIQDRIAFLSNRGGNIDIWIMDIDGGGALQVTKDANPERDISWSRDGKRISYESNYKIWVATFP